MSKVNKHIGDRVLVYAIIWGLSYVGSLFVLKNLSIQKEVGFVLTTITMLAFLVFIYKFYRSVWFMDEFQIKMQLEAILFAFSMCLFLLMTLGLLELFVSLKKEDWSFRHLVPLLFTFYFLGLFISKRKYISTEER